jgi:microcystin-dependent protein
VWAAWSDQPYSTAQSTVSLAPTAVAPAGGGQPHENMPPFLVVNFIISLFGTYPSP